jgi:hypothetical protein
MGYYEEYFIMTGWGGLVDDVRTFYAQEGNDKELMKILFNNYLSDISLAAKWRS